MPKYELQAPNRVWTAEKTKAAIDAALEQDQGDRYRGLLKELLPQQEDIYAQEGGKHRGHLGGSVVGHNCARALWYGFRWMVQKRIPGRLIRLFNRGHMEEPRLVALLKLIGCEVWQIDENGKQFRMQGYRGHYSGSLDGVVRGIPDLPDLPLLSEFKTHSNSSFNKLLKAGVRASKPVHYVQMNEYMHYYRLKYALYVAVNKDNDELYLEIVTADDRLRNLTEEKVILVVDSYTPPPKISESPGWWECKYCDYKHVCHDGVQPAKNCRTCMYARVVDEGDWCCAHPVNAGEILTIDKQHVGCDHYSVLTEV